MGRGDAITAVVQYPGRSFTKVHAVLELTFSVSQRMPQNLGDTSTRQAFTPVCSAAGAGQLSTAVQGVISRVRWEVPGIG